MIRGFVCLSLKNKLSMRAVFYHLVQYFYNDSSPNHHYASSQYFDTVLFPDIKSIE